MALAPIGVGGLFGDDHDDEEAGFQQQYETQTIQIADVSYKIRQFSFHCANANQVWPGAIRLGEYLLQPQLQEKLRGERILELGAATGALAMCLTRSGMNVITSDYCDEDGIIEENLRFNFAMNDIAPPKHIPFTWGTSWAEAIENCQFTVEIRASPMKYIIASDILLYVSKYPALVNALVEIFAAHSAEEFIMSWNRRIAESSIFFDLMKQAGFDCVHLGSCIYSFTRSTPTSASEPAVSVCI